MNYTAFTILFLGLFSCLKTQNQMNPDWPNLMRYQSQNETLLKQPIDSHRVVFMGNSITEAWSQDSLVFFENPSFINRGIGGQTTPQMLTRFRADVIKLNPKAVVILAGINDIAQNTGPMTIEQTMANIKSMSELAHIHGIKVLLCSVLPASEFSWRPEIAPANKVLRLNALIKKFTDMNGFVYVDYYSSMVNEMKAMKSEYTYDEVHCTIAGYRKMESILRESLTKI